MNPHILYNFLGKDMLKTNEIWCHASPSNQNSNYFSLFFEFCTIRYIVLQLCIFLYDSVQLSIIL